MRILTATETAQALPYRKLVPAIAQVALELANGRLNAPERQVVTIDQASVLLCMPAIAPDIGVTKLITVHADNARHGLPAIQGEVVVFDTMTGRRLALLDGPTVTARRTAAVTLLGVETLAPKRPQSALIIGTGIQAAAHIDALIDYFDVASFHIAARSFIGATSFCDALCARHGNIQATPLQASTLQADVPHTDLVIALTTSRTPVIPAALAPQTLAIGVGAFRPDMAEFPADLLHHRRIVVDHLHGAQHEAGDLIQAGIDWSTVRELSSFLGSGEHRSDTIPVFKTVGHAAWDLAAARVATGVGG